MDKATFIEGIAVGTVAGVIATILLAPKSGKETRDEIKGHLEEIRDRIAQQLENTEKLTRVKYEELVRAVVAEYEAARKITVEEAKEIEARLHDGYEAIKETVQRHACGGEQPAADQEPAAAEAVLGQCD